MPELVYILVTAIFIATPVPKYVDYEVVSEVRYSGDDCWAKAIDLDNQKKNPNRVFYCQAIGVG